VITRSNNDRF